jgi:hypothetical protein
MQIPGRIICGHFRRIADRTQKIQENFSAALADSQKMPTFASAFEKGAPDWCGSSAG